VFVLQGKEHVETNEAVPGDIAAVAKVEEITFDSVLHDSHEEDHIHMVPLEFPTPMYGLAIEPKKRGDEQKISEALHKVTAEDPTFQVVHDATTHETVIRGLGDLHVRSILERMNSQYKVEVNTRPPRIPFRETIMAKAEGHARHKKQTGGAGQFGEVYLRVEPLARGAGFEFADQSKGGVIPHQFIPAVEKGVQQVIDSGAVAGYPMQDLRVVVYDGKHHAVDSKEVAFVSAGRKAFLDALEKARPIVLEPIVNVEIICPETCMGDITGDLSGKRGQITGTDSLGAGTCAIRGLAPLAELNGYANRLKSVTGGQGSYSMSLSHYEAVPPNVQAQLHSEYLAARGQQEEE
jgi:elongation factor G